MVTIRKRRKKDGSFSYLVQIRIARRGQPDYSESKTFPKKSMAVEWAKRRELELAAPGGVLTAKWKGVTLHDAIKRYLHEFADGAGRSKRATIEQLQRFLLPASRSPSSAASRSSTTPRCGGAVA
ncbi:hypothetical protein [Vreelandella olivaria]|uniref:hypothetical protein n=1 Tax=Vreelandella olivaria TaxID=390919 RepID=UPI00201FAD4F|nr:hypothetical protein [Halomonas olivaria]